MKSQWFISMRIYYKNEMWLMVVKCTSFCKLWKMKMIFLEAILYETTYAYMILMA